MGQSYSTNLEELENLQEKIEELEKKILEYEQQQRSLTSPPSLTSPSLTSLTSPPTRQIYLQPEQQQQHMSVSPPVLYSSEF